MKAKDSSRRLNILLATCYFLHATYELVLPCLYLVSCVLYRVSRKIVYPVSCIKDKVTELVRLKMSSKLDHYR